MRGIRIFTICVISIIVIIALLECFTYHEMNNTDDIKFITIIISQQHYNHQNGYTANNEKDVKLINNFVKMIHFFQRKTEPLLDWYTFSRKQEVIVLIKYKDETTRIIETEGCEAVIFDRSNDNRPVLDSVKCYYVNPLEIKMLLNHFIPK